MGQMSAAWGPRSHQGFSLPYFWAEDGKAVVQASLYWPYTSCCACSVVGNGLSSRAGLFRQGLRDSDLDVHYNARAGGGEAIDSKAFAMPS